jgi:hypothetical protein
LERIKENTHKLTQKEWREEEEVKTDRKGCDKNSRIYVL